MKILLKVVGNYFMKSKSKFILKILGKYDPNYFMRSELS